MPERSDILTVGDREVITRIVLERVLCGEEASWPELKAPGASRRRVYLRAEQIAAAAAEIEHAVNSAVEAMS